MKFLFAFVLSLLSLAGFAQTTNIYPSDPFAQTGAQQINCSGQPKYVSRGTANWHAPGMVSSNKFFYPLSSNLLITLPTNLDARVQYLSSFGPNGCSNGTISWVDTNWQHAIYVFSVFWSNNVPVPTNGTRLNLTTVNFRTNSP